MIRARKRLLVTKVASASALLPILLSGCSILGGNDDDYIDYTTDRLRVSAQPAIGAALPPYLPYIDDNIKPGVYASAGLGISQLQPDTSEAESLTVNDKNSGAGQATLGIDINSLFSVEIHSADLGSAGFDPAGRIGYQLNGISALYYAGKNRKKHKRQGFTGFGRVGVALLDNSTEGEISYTRSNDTQLLYGAGLEYMTRSGFGLRGELISFDRDAQYAQLGLMYRFGRNQQRAALTQAPVVQPVAPIAAAPVPEMTPAPVVPAPAPAPVITAAPVLAAAAAPADSDQDGIADHKDHCPASISRITVDSHGCAVFSGTLKGLNFPSNSANLTDEARTVLDQASRKLQNYPDSKILVKAHTDNNGNSERNQWLSEHRALAVVGYLVANGIPYSRLTAKAYGEREPIDTNSTAQGRANNRRVELIAMQSRHR